MIRRLCLFAAVLVCLSFVPAAFAASAVVQFPSSVITVPEHNNRFAYAIINRSGDTTTDVGFTMNVVDETTGYTFNWGWGFKSGETTASLATNIIVGGPDISLDDNVYNPGRKWRCTLTQVTNGVIGTPSVTEVVVVDDELPPVMSIDDITAEEGSYGSKERPAIFTIKMGTALGVTTFVPVTVHNGSAKAGTDFVNPPGFVIFSPRQSVASFSVSLVQDNEPEGDETFSIELGTPSPSIPGLTVQKSVGTCLILDDDGAVSPALQRVARGTKGSIQVRVGDPAVSTETVLLQTSDNFLSIPSSVAIPAGASGVDIDVTTNGIGTGTIFVTLPASRGGRTFPAVITVYDPIALSIDPISLPVMIGTTANVNLKIDPPPATPIVVSLTQSAPSVAEIPQSVTVGTSGVAQISVRGVRVGFTSVTATLPEANGASAMGFVVDVTVPNGFAITSVSQRSGRASGGESVQIFGNNLAGTCVVTFGGVPSPNTSAPANGAVSAITPPHDAGVVDVALRCGTNIFALPNWFTFNAVAPTNTVLLKASGTTRGGTLVPIQGTNLRYVGCNATFGGVPAHTVSWNGNASLLVSTPPHDPGTVAVRLVCGSETYLLQNYTYLAIDDPAPALSLASPNRAAPGDRVVISGASFRTSDVVLINGGVIPLDVPLTSSLSRTITVPDVAPGTATIAIRDDAGRTSNELKIDITVPNTPAISRVDADVTAGAEFIVTGSGFRRSLTYALGFATLQPIAITSNSVVLRAPNVAPGAYTLTISDHGSAVASQPIDITSSGLGVATM